jgi:NAD(P)-dependent dehydrogenase (short-subunit alcohol dehydrogenase family)
VAVVTGGGRGIGRGISLALAAAGFDLVIGWHKGGEDAAATVAAAEELGAVAVPVCGDIAHAHTASALAQAATATFGRLDVWVNNAGILTVGPLLELTLPDFERTLQVNLIGAFHGTQAAARTMIGAGRGGRIINISSEAGLRAWPLYGAYAPTKFAMIGLTQVAALELGRAGILVNAVCPGLVETDMVAQKWPEEAALRGTSVDAIRAENVDATPSGRLATTEDIGAAVAWLAGSGASSVTGQSICVNGGMTLH